MSTPTDTAEFLEELNGGAFASQIGHALSEIAVGVVDHGKTGKLVITPHLASWCGTFTYRDQSLPASFSSGYSISFLSKLALTLLANSIARPTGIFILTR